MLCRQIDEQTDIWTDRRTTVKQYAPDLSIRRHKKPWGKKNHIQKKKINVLVFLIKKGKTIKVEGIIQGGYLHFFFSPQCFQKVFSLESLGSCMA